MNDMEYCPRGVLDVSPEAIYVTDMEYNLLYANKLAQQMGRAFFQKENPCGKCYQALLGRTEPCPFCKISQMSDESFTTRNFSGATGRVFQIQGRLIDWNGIPAHIEYIRDITAQKSAEKRSEELSMQQKELYEHVGTGMCLFQFANGEMQAVISNQKYRQLLQLPEEFDTGEAIPWKTTYFAENDQKELYDAFMECVYSNKAFNRICHVRDKKTGLPKSILLNMEAVPQEDGSTYWYASAYDMSALEEKEQQLNGVLNSIDGGIVIYKITKEGHIAIEMYTDGIAKMHGLTRQEYDKRIQDDVMKMIYSEDRAFLGKEISTAFPKKEGLSTTFRGYHKTKKFVWVNMSATPTEEDADGCMRYTVVYTAASREFELYQQLLNLSENGAVVYDRKTSEPYFSNLSAKQLLKNAEVKPFDGDFSPRKMRFHGGYYQVYTHPIEWLGRPSVVQYFLNITEEVELRRQLTLDEELYRTVVEQSAIAFLSYDLVGENTYCNDLFKPYTAFCSSYREFFDTHKLFAKVHSKDHEILRHFIDEIKTNRAASIYPIRMKMQDGSYRWVEMHGIAIDNENGVCVRKICFIKDVDEATKQYLELKARYDYETKKQNEFDENIVERLLIDLTDNKVFHATDAAGKTVNKMIGLTVEQLLAMRLTHAMDDYEKAELTKLMNRESLLEAYRHAEFPELEIKNPMPGTPEKQYYHTYVRETKNPENDHIMAFFITRNVDKEKTSELLMRRLLEINYTRVLLVHAQTGRIKMRYSKGDERFLTGIEPSYDELCEANIKQTVPLENQDQIIYEMRLSTIRESLKSASQCSGRTMIMQDDQSSFTTWTAAYFDEEKEYILITSADATDVYKKDLENNAKLAEALENAEVASKAKSTFLARMSHEIRTPITTISGILELIRQDCIARGIDASILLERIDTASTANQYLLTLINDILDISKVENNELTVTPVPANIKSIIEPVLAMARPLAERKRIHFITERKTCNSEWYNVDTVRVSQIVMNLLSNAMKFTPESGTVTFTGETMLIAENRVMAKMVVSDTGVGISKEFMKDVFEPFKQEYSGSKSQYGGTGIGLSISRSLARLMGGDITVESEKGKGTTFTVTMEWDIVPPQESEPTLNENEDMRLDGITVLLCEDNQINQMIAEQLLIRQGCTVLKANDGQEAIDQFLDSKIGEIDFILMDVRMPNVDGLEATQLIRKMERADAKTVPIVAMSANAYAEDKKLSLDAGMNDHLSKPVEPKVLYRTIRKYR
ncbi:MAG: ATP-binding protein [Lachnospiraceae bacterium]|nr:ATP-binding protein [Lachnospiraceae bacterium]